MCVIILIIVIILFLLYIIYNSKSYEHYIHTHKFNNTLIDTILWKGRGASRHAPHLILYCPNTNTDKLTRTMGHWDGFVQYANTYMPYLKINKINYTTDKTNINPLPVVVLHNKLGRMIIYHGDITIHNLIRFVNNHS